jgi:hypothetical protein
LIRRPRTTAALSAIAGAGNWAVFAIDGLAFALVPAILFTVNAALAVATIGYQRRTGVRLDARPDWDDDRRFWRV